jgi:hypothetical protein
MEQAGENLRDHRFPARIRALDQRLFERGLVCVDEALAHLLRRLPAAIGHTGGTVDVLDILLDELAAVRAQGGVQELDGCDAIEIGRSSRLSHAVEDAHDLVLPGDDVLGRQVTQPGGDRACGHERVGFVLGLRRQEAKHGRREFRSEGAAKCSLLALQFGAATVPRGSKRCHAAEPVLRAVLTKCLITGSPCHSMMYIHRSSPGPLAAT